MQLFHDHVFYVETINGGFQVGISWGFAFGIPFTFAMIWVGRKINKAWQWLCQQPKPNPNH